MRIERLDLCPFCGGRAQFVVDDETEELLIVQCASCKASTAGFESEREAREAWNRRTDRLPCKIGDTVWAIRNFSGTLIPKCGRVSELYFLPDMTLTIVVKHICRGIWGKTVFATKEQAEEAIEKGRSKWT